MIRICTSLARAGYEVWLVGRKRPASRLLKEEPFRQKRLSCSFQKGKLFYLEYNLRLFLFLLATPFDTVCSVDLDTILPGFLASRLKGKTCVYDAHEYFTEVPEVVRRPAVKRIWEWVARFTIPRLKYAYTVGPGLARLLEERFGIPFEVVRNVPLSSTRLQKNNNPVHEKPIILYQGALNEGRGLEYAVEAMQEITGAELWLAGEGDLSDSLRDQAREKKLEDKVRFLGFMPPAELQALTPQAHIGLNLLENKGLSYYYSLANKAFDYIQAGVPSINMAFPEYVAIQEKYNVFILLDELSPTLIRQAVIKLMQEKEAYEQLRNNCLQAAKTLNWEKEEAILLGFYSQACPLGVG
ncbi:MAG: glycosyltransferase [Phaeodactylibacter sp.]|nr:glycosyltransferase [Phaeodactylibacter sp.]